MTPLADTRRDGMAKWLGALVGIGGLCVATAAQAQSYPARPVRNVAELIALAKSWRPEISSGTAGIGSAPHMNIELLENMAGIKLVPVHYRGAAPALTDLLGGHIKLMSVSMTLSREPAKAGRITMLGVGSRQRLPQAPDVPTVAETGLPGYEAVSWVGLFPPSGTPPDIVMTR